MALTPSRINVSNDQSTLTLGYRDHHVAGEAFSLIRLIGHAAIAQDPLTMHDPLSGQVFLPIKAIGLEPYQQIERALGMNVAMVRALDDPLGRAIETQAHRAAENSLGDLGITGGESFVKGSSVHTTIAGIAASTTELIRS